MKEHRGHEHHVAQLRDPHDTPAHYMPGLVEFFATFRNWTKTTEIAPNWRTNTRFTKAGEVTGILILNRQRKRALVWTAAANTGLVWISANPINNDPTGSDNSNAVPLAPGSTPLEFHHCGHVYAWSASSQTVYTVSEYLT